MADAVTDTRRAAFDTLSRIRDGDLADRALARSAEGLDSRDHAWLLELVYGTLRLRGRLDFVLASFVRSGLDSLDPPVLDVLRLGAYQILEMGSVPAYAAVSQSVELVRDAGAGRAAGLVNGVLQSVRRGAASVEFPPFESDPVGHLVSWGSHPRWLVERWVSRWDPAEARRLVELNNERPALYLRPVGVSTEQALASLGRGDIEAEPVAGFPDSVRVLGSGTPLEALAAVPAVVQDPAAAMVVRYAEVLDGATVLDMAAAPGGKSTGLTDRAGYVVAADLSIGRLRRVRANVTRAGVSDRVGLVVADGRAPPFAGVDAVLLDAPCTGTGTLRRHPDGRWRISEDDLLALAVLQRDLLESAATVVRPGGHLVYATCSIEPEENEEQIAGFLSRHPEYDIAAPDAPLDGTMVRDGLLSLLPQRHGVDGAFAARMVRKA
ncbi:MAG: transcription antitermination factor NusB [Gemmatimonadota bacterium]